MFIENINNLETTHCLIVQPDSFVVNYELWKNEFLKYDYIGAPWSDKVKINSNVTLNLKKILLVMVGFHYEAAS